MRLICFPVPVSLRSCSWMAGRAPFPAMFPWPPGS